MFDVIPTPQVKQRDKQFEKFLLDDNGKVIDGTQDDYLIPISSEGILVLLLSKLKEKMLRGPFFPDMQMWI